MVGNVERSGKEPALLNAKTGATSGATVLGPCRITRIGAMREIWGPAGGHVGGEVESYMGSIMLKLTPFRAIRGRTPGGR